MYIPQYANLAFDILLQLVRTSVLMQLLRGLSNFLVVQAVGVRSVQSSQHSKTVSLSLTQRV